MLVRFPPAIVNNKTKVATKTDNATTAIKILQPISHLEQPALSELPCFSTVTLCSSFREVVWYESAEKQCRVFSFNTKITLNYDIFPIHAQTKLIFFQGKRKIMFRLILSTYLLRPSRSSMVPFLHIWFSVCWRYVLWLFWCEIRCFTRINDWSKSFYHVLSKCCFNHSPPWLVFPLLW